jgi:hypothetical protein
MISTATTPASKTYANAADYAAGKRRAIPDTAEDAAAIAAYEARRAAKGAKAPTDVRAAARAAYDLSAAKAGATKGANQTHFEFLWAKVKTAYAAGEAAALPSFPWKDVVCYREALKAMRHLVPLKGKSKLPTGCGKGWDLDCGIVAEGYARALRAWDRFDPAKDKGNGLAAYLYKTAEGAIRNAAWEQFSASGKRERSEPGEVMPKMREWKPNNLAHSLPFDAPILCLRTDPAPDYEDDAGDDSEAVELAYTIAKDDKQPGLRFTAAVNNLTSRGENGNRVDATERLDYQDRPDIVAAAAKGAASAGITPSGKAIYDLQGLIDGSRVIEIERLLSGLRPTDRTLISRVYGTDGHAEMSIRELAKQNGCSEAAMAKRVYRIEEEIRNYVSLV